eukprot:20048_1
MKTATSISKMKPVPTTRTPKPKRAAGADSPIEVHHWRHNQPFVQFMLKFLLVFLCTGLFLNAIANYFRNRVLITTGVGEEIEIYKNRNDVLWKPVHHHSDIRIFETHERRNGTHIHPIYHYEYQTRIPLEAFLDVLDHPDQSMEWFAWLKDHKYMGVRKNELENLDILSNTLHSQMIIHPLIHLQDREFLNEVTSNIATEKFDDGSPSGGEKTTVTFFYRNLGGEDEVENKFTKHDHKDCKRGALNMVLHLSTKDEGATTHIDMELDMDMYPCSSRTNMSISTPWILMDKMVMRWGEVSLHKLVKRCNENLGLDHTLNLKTSLWNLIPIKR